jgi:hypothetical protein
VKPLPQPEPPRDDDPIGLYLDPLLRAKQEISRDFGNRFRLYEKKPYLLAFEPSSRVTNALMEDYGNRLGMLYASFRSEFGLDKLDDVLTVVVLLSRESFDNYWSRRGSAMPQQIHGVYDSGTRRIVLYLGYEAPDEVLFHEGAHQLVHHYARRLTGERDITWMYWFHEGVGTYFEGFRRGPGGEIELDPRVNRTRLPIVKHAMMDPAERKNFVSLNVLTGVTVDEFWEWFRSGREAEKANLYYAESWAFTYFLRQRGGDYRRTFDDYFQECLSGRGDKETFERLVRRNLGMELAELEREFIEYITSLP